MVAPPGYLPGNSTPPGYLSPNFYQQLSGLLGGLGQGLLAGRNWGQGIGLGLQQGQEGLLAAQQRQQQAEMYDLQKKKLQKELDTSAAEDLVQAVDPKTGQLVWMPKSQAAGLGSQKDKPFVPNIETIIKGGSQESGYFNQAGEWVPLGSGPRFAPTQGRSPTDEEQYSRWLTSDNPTLKAAAERYFASVGAVGDQPTVQIYDPTSPTGIKIVPRSEAVGQPGVPPAAANKLNEAQMKALQYYSVAKQANEGLDKNPAALTDLGGYVASKFGTAGNYLKSDEYRQIEQQAVTFTEQYYRALTGAAAPEAEYNRMAQQIIPKPGDDAGTIALKRATRAQWLEAIRLTAEGGGKVGGGQVISGQTTTPAIPPPPPGFEVDQ